MSSQAFAHYVGTYVGAADEVNVEKVPFRPRVIRFVGASGLWGYKSDQMAGDAYYSNTNPDAGCTINDDGFTLANGADVNDDGNVVHFECFG